MNQLKELLLGDNPFFGVDNLSQERGRERIGRLNELNKIVEIMDFVEKLGVKGFVVSTHPQLKDLIKYLKNETQLLKKFEFYPILPYAQGYVSKVAEKGIIKGMNEILKKMKELRKKIKEIPTVRYVEYKGINVGEPVVDEELSCKVH